jgi:hypothetical protein
MIKDGTPASATAKACEADNTNRITKTAAAINRLGIT